MTECRMPFGKYKQMTISEIFEEDSDYLHWFYNNVNDNESIKKEIYRLFGGEPYEESTLYADCYNGDMEWYK